MKFYYINVYNNPDGYSIRLQDPRELRKLGKLGKSDKEILTTKGTISQLWDEFLFMRIITEPIDFMINQIENDPKTKLL